MNGSVLAQVRRILTDPSGRALIHAVDDAGLEYKIEAPLEAVRGVTLEQGPLLAISWSLRLSPRPGDPASVPPGVEPPPTVPPAPRSTPSAIDRAFMELMASPSGATAPMDSSTRGTSPELAELLGVKRSE